MRGTTKISREFLQQLLQIPEQYTIVGAKFDTLANLICLDIHVNEVVNSGNFLETTQFTLEGKRKTNTTNQFEWQAKKEHVLT